MGCCVSRRIGNREKKPLLSETSKQKLAMERAILLEHPQRTLEINIDDIHSHNSLQQSSITNYRHNQSLKGQQQIGIEKSLERCKDGSITFFPLSIKANCKLLPTESIIHSNQLKCLLYGTNNSINNIETISVNKDFKILQYNNHNNKYIHPFINCVQIAYFNHYPMKISPSHIWLLILQSVSIHIHLDINKHESNSEHIIAIETDIETEIDKNIINTAQLLVENNYTTSTKLENIASKILLMSIYEQKQKTLPQNDHPINIDYNKCIQYNARGFTSIHLNGTKQDWIKLKTNTINLLKSDTIETEFCKKWSLSLIPILDKFIHVYDDGETIDKKFWNNMIVPTVNDDGETIDKKLYNYDGWINVLFPRGFGFGVSLTTVNINNNLKDFLCGYLGIIQHKDTAIEPYIGNIIVNRSNDTQ